MSQVWGRWSPAHQLAECGAVRVFAHRCLAGRLGAAARSRRIRRRSVRHRPHQCRPTGYLMATVSPLLQRFEHPASILHQGLHSVRWGVSVFSAQSWIRPYVSSGGGLGSPRLHHRHDHDHTDSDDDYQPEPRRPAYAIDRLGGTFDDVETCLHRRKRGLHTRHVVSSSVNCGANAMISRYPRVRLFVRFSDGICRGC